MANRDERQHNEPGPIGYASRLDHPNICAIYKINETDDGQLYPVMAQYEAETLKERIARGPLDPVYS